MTTSEFISMVLAVLVAVLLAFGILRVAAEFDWGADNLAVPVKDYSAEDELDEIEQSIEVPPRPGRARPEPEPPSSGGVAPPEEQPEP